MTIGGGVFFFSGSFLSSSCGSRGSGSLTTSTRRVLSGDHAKSDTPPLTSVSLLASPPTRFINHTWPFLASWREERKARYLLSGLQRGVDSLSGDEVS